VKKVLGRKTNCTDRLQRLRSSKNLFKKSLLILALSAALLLTACGAPSGDARPSDSNLVTGINLLLNTFGKNHPKLINWKTEAVKNQLKLKLPIGISTDAGWYLKWNDPGQGELSQVYIPWKLLGQYPNSPQPAGYKYPGGNLVPQTTINDLTIVVQNSEMQRDDYFAAVTGVRSSKINPQWLIFTTVPYLPVTDNAYGFATVRNRQWVVTDFGTANVGCGKVPTEVESEFGFKCP
jgi:hypothetical protein